MDTFLGLFTIISMEHPLHSENHERLLCPTTGREEPMRLQLYAQEIRSYGIFVRIARRPIGRFFRVEDGEEIEARHWTTEMTKAHDIAIKGNTPVRGKRVSVTLYGRMVIVVLLFAIIALVYSIYTRGQSGQGGTLQDSIRQEAPSGI